ncbi:hypothetical protein LWI28_022058 [Acer negundo]|uniref:Pentatricopeptide repeat-containing protein n=1 Tax=Acer negundo TaxID=4023 RepID=A0AAD5NYU7_ACENE|nr:hypothetical protein LWI28_022058 [Acer negundo]
MLVTGVKPNLVTVTGFEEVEKFRDGYIGWGLILMYLLVVHALIDMYSKCGSVIDARNVFDMIYAKNVASWNAMSGCYEKHGMVDASMELFERMQKEGMQPHEVTFIAVLSACSHGDLVEKGLKIFRSMKETYGVEISKEHYACVVDIFCRSGKMVEAYELVRGMPIEITNSIAGAFFNGC